MTGNAAGAEGAGRSASGVSTRARIREVFAGEGFRDYFATRGISQFGDGLFQLSAAAVLLFEHPGRNPAMALLAVSAITLIPFSAMGPFVGVFIDRWDRRKIIVRVPLARAAAAAMLPIAALAGTRSIPFYAVVLIVLSANRFFLATMSAVLPQLVPPDDLLVANSVSATGGALANVAGQAIGTVIAGTIGGIGTAVVAAFAFAASTLAARALDVHRGLDAHRAPLREEVAEVLAEMVEGAREVSRNRHVRFALSAIAVTQVMVGALIAVLVYYFVAILQEEVRAATVVLGFLAIGIGVGVVLVPMAARRMRYDLIVIVSFLIAGAGTAFAAFRLSRLSLIVIAGVVGAAYSFAKIPVDTIVQEEMDDELRGRAFALYDMLFNVTRVVGIAAVAFLFEVGVEPARILAMVAAGYGVATVGFALWERSMEMRKRREPKPASLLVPGEFVTVRSHEGMRADEEPRVVVVGGHEMRIEAIEWRAVVETEGVRRRAFVCRVGELRVRLEVDDEGAWTVARLL